MTPVNAVNTTTLTAPDYMSSIRVGEENTPTTPKPSTRFLEQPSKDAPSAESADLVTPTRYSFGGVLGQRPLPDGPVTPSRATDGASAKAEEIQRENSQRSTHSHRSSDSQDVEMGEHEDDEDGSDNESVNSDSPRPSKKKKGQRFFCTEFPPCQLSFTRSEHLARHIRKHTGERPFQCHCSRRFSRLDNLRQHAQTVHVNEEIPGDSLAATSTRFQRQIRTDRVRPPNNRSRAGSTISSSGGHSRGHSRNLSSSSVTSTASNMSMADGTRRRPPPIAMANDGAVRARLSLNPCNPVMGIPSEQYAYYDPLPSGYSTPTSMTFSNGTGSPRFASGMASPISTISRSSFYNGSRAPGRRLSVPSGGSPYQQHHSQTYPPSFFSPIPSGTAVSFSQNNSVFASPTGSVFSHGRRESDAELDWRRRTWHPGTYANYTQRPATSGLTYHQTPDEPKPAFSTQPAATQITRLPGIESFDHAPPGSARQPDSLQVDPAPRPISYPGTGESGLPQNLTRLDINAANAPMDGQYQDGRPSNPPQRYSNLPGNAPPAQRDQQSAMEQPITPRRNKRQAWYNGPIAPGTVQPMYLTQRTSPEDSGSSDGVPTPSATQVTEYHPAIVHANGMLETHPSGATLTMEDPQKAHYSTSYQASKPEPARTDSGFQSYVQMQHPPPQTYQLQTCHDPRFVQGYMQAPERANSDMGRLEVLVAVATSENRAVEHRS